jgi:hypothetical protein
LVETTFSIFKTELLRNPVVVAVVGGHWKGLAGLELETSE